MKHLTAEDLAIELGLESGTELFEGMISDFESSNLIAARANFNMLRAANQKQLLKYCNEYNNDDAYNFFHSLI